MSVLRLFLVAVAVLAAGCLNPTKAVNKVRDMLMRAEGSIEIAFALHGHYVVYTARALYLLDDVRLDDEYKARLQKAVDDGRPFADPLILATVELVEFKEYAKYDPEMFHTLHHNVNFWIAHFEPHVEILINTVRGSQVRLNALDKEVKLACI